MKTADPGVTSLADLMGLEARIAEEVRKHPLDGLLLALRALPPQGPEDGRGIPPHVIGTAARFATRFGSPGPMTASATPVSRAAIQPLLHLAGDFAHADPCAWLGKPSDSIFPLLLRVVGNQFPYNINASGKWGRAEIMFNELPGLIRGKNGVPDFDFGCRFRELTGVSVSEFIDIGYLTWCAAKSGNQLGFTRGYFEKARRDGLTIGDDDVVRKVLSHYAADSSVHSALSENTMQPVRDYAANDFNSLFVYPLIRPWPQGSGEQLDLDRMVAPIPDLILYRMTSGIYYHMRKAYSHAFDNFFGHLLSAYVGRILSSFVPPADLISEEDIRKTFPTSAGKAPDWVIIERKTAILIEVKVARVHRIVYATGDVEKLDENLEAVRHGLQQMFEFQTAVSRREPGLERLGRCKEFINVVVTLEPTYLADSAPFKDRFRSSLDPAMRSLDWAMLSLDQLEWFQVHLSDPTIDVASAFRHSLRATAYDVVNALSNLSQFTGSQSMLNKKQDELHRRLGVAAR
jgi:hypothetical protein